MQKYPSKIFLASLTLAVIHPKIYAGPANVISNFWVFAETSAMYNPVLPTPLTPTTVLNLNWETLPESSLTVPLRANGGGWIAFLTAMLGYSLGTPIATYKNTPAIYFGTYNLLDAGGTKYGQLDEYYCNCSAAGLFSVDAYSINSGKRWTAQMSVW